MRAAVGGAVVLGLLAGTSSPALADVFLLRDRKGVLHITNAPVDPGSKLDVRQPPPAAKPTVVGNQPPNPNRNRVLLPLIDPGLMPMAVLSKRVAMGPRQPSLPPATPSVPTPYDEAIRIIADSQDVEYALVKAIIKAESGFNHLAVSPKGAQGLMQLMPGTAAEVNVQDAFSPHENIAGGVRYLRQMLDRFAGNLAFAVAAYNAGPNRVEQAGGIPDIAETRDYVAKVLRYRLGYLREGAGVRQARR